MILQLPDVRWKKSNHIQIFVQLFSQTMRPNRRRLRDVKAVNEQIKVILTSWYSLRKDDISNESYDGYLQLHIKMSILGSTVKEMLTAT